MVLWDSSGKQKYMTFVVVLPTRYENNCNTIKSHKHIARSLFVISRHIYHRNGDILNSTLNVGDILNENSNSPKHSTSFML